MNELDINYNEIEDLDYCIELLNKKDKIIIFQANEIQNLIESNNKFEMENIRLNNIIKEVREYIENNSEIFDGGLCTGDYFELKDIVEILDKVEDKQC